MHAGVLLTLFQAIRVFSSGVEHTLARPSPLAPGARVDLNRARLPELMLLPGLGPARAEAIILHRVRHGPFEHLEDLLRVPGIGPRTLDRLAPDVAPARRAGPDRRAPR